MAVLAANHKAEDIRAYDVHGLTLIADSFLLCSTRSEPQTKAVVKAVKEGMAEAGVKPNHVEGTSSAGWVLMDYGDVIFHIFRKEMREFYDLDGLWADAPRLELGLESS